MKLQSNRPGFALPLALLVIGFISVGVATAFSRVDAEGRINRDRDAQLDAFAIAEGGLQSFAVSRASLGLTTSPPAVSESARINLAGGYADVVSRQVRPKVGNEPPLYLIRSRGVNTAGALAWTPPAKHTVAQYAFFREGSMNVLSSWTSLTGMRKNGGSGTISGYDNCLDPSGNPMQPPVGGVGLPHGTYEQNGGTLVPVGNPDFYYRTQQELVTELGIDWAGIVNGTALAPDIVTTCSGGTCTPWPSFTDPDYWPVILVNGNISLPSSGRGTLIVTGDLTINGSAQWNGIVLVGRNLTADGSNRVLGAVVTGLNVILGQAVPINDVGNGNNWYQYDSCNVASAVNRFSALVLIPSTWMDNWPSW